MSLTTNAERRFPQAVRYMCPSARRRLGCESRNRTGARDAPVGVALIYDHVAQVGQDAAEMAVHGQDAAVDHVGVGDQQLRTVPRLPADALTHRTAGGQNMEVAGTSSSRG